MRYLNGQKVYEGRDIKRGEIYYIKNGSSYQVGCEMKKDRPAVIVSCNANNINSTMVTVVYLTTKPKKELPTHVTIRSSKRQSKALCEEPTSISIERINKYLGEVTDEELWKIESALMIGMGIRHGKCMDEVENRIEDTIRSLERFGIHKKVDVIKIIKTLEWFLETKQKHLIER